MKYNNSFICKFFLFFSDLLILNVSLFISSLFVYFLFGNLWGYIQISPLDVRVSSHFILSVLCVVWFLVRLMHYTYRKPFWSELKEILRTIIIFSVIDLALVAFSKWHFSRYLWFFTWFLAAIFVPIGRILIRRILDKMSCWKKDTIIIGSSTNAIDAFYALSSEKQLGFKVKLFVSTSNLPNQTLFNLPVVCSEDFDLNSLNKFDTQFILALEYEQHDLMDFWLRKLAGEGIRTISVIPALRGVPLYSTDVSFFFSHEVMILRINNNLAKRTSRVIKRFVDILGSLFLLILLSPLLAYLAYKVSRDGGNPFYGHERIGQHGKKFNCYKLRSMIINSQEVLQKLLNIDQSAKAEWDKDFKLKNDPRITKVGHFIRKTSLDELPQLWNVLKGDMSLVGPRPIVEGELERYKDDVDYYLMAKPGMTGLWQVSGRNDVDYETRVYLDSWYVKNWTLWNDIAILFKTINVVLKRDGAY